MNSIFDIKTFYKLIITPFELELAFSQEWLNYIMIDSNYLKS